MTTSEPSENLQHFLELQKQTSKKKMNLFKEKKKTFRPPCFQISYLPHFLFVLNNLKSYGSFIWNFTKSFSSAKTIEWRPKILSSKMQIGHMCQPTCPWPSSLGKDISCSFLHQFEHFLLSWTCHLKLYKNKLKCKDNRVTSKDLKLENAKWSYVPTHIMPHDPLHLEKAHLVHFFINLNDFCCIRCAKWKATKCYWAPKAIEHCTKTYKSLSLRYQ
jgi:hypothetical protein